MARKVETGLYSKALTDSIRIAEVLQAEAVLAIQDAYGVKEDRLVDINGLTWEMFNEVLDKAARSGRKEELEQELREMLAEALITVMSQPPQEA